MERIPFFGYDNFYYHNSFLKPITLAEFLDYLSRCYLSSFEIKELF